MECTDQYILKPLTLIGEHQKNEHYKTLLFQEKGHNLSLFSQHHFFGFYVDKLPFQQTPKGSRF